MNVLRKFAGIIAAAALALTAPVQQAAAADLKNDPFVTRNADRKNFEPGGQYHLFGTPRGSVTERTGSIGIRQAYTHQTGNLLIQQADINGTIGYKTRFSGHGHEVHAPFDNHAARSASDEKGSVSQGFTVYRLEWSGREHHPADGYDGPQGGGYPAPKGARDEYSYKVEGTARSIRLNPQDTRSIGQRFRDNHNNLRGNFSERAREANKKMFEHNPNLSRWGNAMEFINGVAAGALNPFQSTAEALGIDGILDGAGYATDKAAMYAVAPLSAEGKLAAIGAAGSVAGFKQDIGEAVNQWIRENPNAAETFEALPPVKSVKIMAKLPGGGKRAKTGGGGKADVSDNFADAYKAKANTDYSRISTGRTEAKNLKEQLAMESVKNDPQGRTLPIKMNDSKNNLYEKDGWVKKAQNVNGVEIHYIENSKTGVKADFKFKD